MYTHLEIFYSRGLQFPEPKIVGVESNQTWDPEATLGLPHGRDLSALIIVFCFSGTLARNWNESRQIKT